MTSVPAAADRAAAPGAARGRAPGSAAGPAPGAAAGPAPDAARGPAAGPAPGAPAGHSAPAGACGLVTGPHPELSGALTWSWRPPFPLDLARTLAVHRRGGADPAFRVEAPGVVWRTSLAPDGPGTLRLAMTRAPSARTPAIPDRPGWASAADDSGTGPEPTVRAAAWGPGAAWLIARVPALLGAGDDSTGFAPDQPLLRHLWLRYHAVRLGRSHRVLESLVPAVLEQKVVGAEAWRAWRWLMLRFGEPAPGPAPAGMRVFPGPDVWRSIPSWEWHRAGVEAVRARTVIGAARDAARLEEIISMPSAAADRRLRSFPGIGGWTSAEVRQRACGDPDAVSVGDYHLPGAVGWALAGREVDDAGMLELLAPYAGHRHRVTRLIEMSGIGPPRRGPRHIVRDYRSF